MEYNEEKSIMEVRNRLQVGDTMEILVPHHIEPVVFKIEKMWDIETDKEIEFINPGVKGQQVKILLPIKCEKIGLLEKNNNENIKDYNLDSLKEEFVQMGEKPFRAEQVFKWLYEEKVKEFDEMTNLSLQLREKLKENYTMCNFKILRKLESSDGTKNIYLTY